MLRGARCVEGSDITRGSRNACLLLYGNRPSLAFCFLFWNPDVILTLSQEAGPFPISTLQPGTKKSHEYRCALFSMICSGSSELNRSSYIPYAVLSMPNMQPNSPLFFFLWVISPCYIRFQMQLGVQIHQNPITIWNASIFFHVKDFIYTGFLSDRRKTLMQKQLLRYTPPCFKPSLCGPPKVNVSPNVSV